VKNLERSIEYYARLGFTPQFRFTKNGKQFGAYLKIADGNYIEIFENPEIDKVQEGGIAHFCLETDDIDSLIRNSPLVESSSLKRSLVVTIHIRSG
jgi:lactoylglutathione lyase/glyoxylase I family protein